MHLGVMAATGTSWIAITKQCSHVILHCTAASLSNGNPGPNCHCNPKTTCTYLLLISDYVFGKLAAQNKLFGAAYKPGKSIIYEACTAIHHINMIVLLPTILNDHHQTDLVEDKIIAI